MIKKYKGKITIFINTNKKIIILVGVIFVLFVAGVVLNKAANNNPVTKPSLTPYSSIDQQIGRTVFSLSTQSGYLYKSKTKKGLEVALEFLKTNPSFNSDQTLFPKNFSDNTNITREEKDINDKYLIKNNIALNNEHYFFDQKINNIPVYGANVVVHVRNNDEVYSTTGNTSTSIERTEQKITDKKAEEIAIQQAVKEGEKGELIVKTTKKYYINKKVMGLANDPINHIALDVDVESAGKPVLFRTQYFIDLSDGSVIYSESQTRDALSREVFNCQGGSCVSARQEGGGPSPDTDVNKVYGYFGDIYDYFSNTFNRNSYDDAGAPLNGYVHAPTGFSIHGAQMKCPNAFWNGSEMVFCSGLALLDVTAHELTHAITSTTANLQYLNESGALNEAMSDIFGSALDNNWDIGEELPPGIGLPVPLRSMSNPPQRNQPDMLSTYSCTSQDNGGVHMNSGIINKSFYLITIGGYFNGCSIDGIGRSKSYPIAYQALTKYLTSTSNFKDTYTTFLQACADLYGATSTECDNVNRAMQATQIDQQTVGSSTSPVCGGGGAIQAPTCASSGSPSPNPSASPSVSPSPSVTLTPIPTVGVSSGQWKMKITPICDGSKSEFKFDYEIPSGKKGYVKVWVTSSNIEDSSPDLEGNSSYIAMGNKLTPLNSGLKGGVEYTGEMIDGPNATGGIAIMPFKLSAIECTPASTPTSAPSDSTPTPSSGGGWQKNGNPTPTPDQYFTCGPDPKCIKSGKNIQLCPLKCEPVPK